MKENADEDYSLSDVVNTFRLFSRYLLRKWWLFVLVFIAGGLLGLLFYSVQKPKYEAVCTFILEEKQAGMGGLGGIASQFGFDIGALSGGSGSIFAGDNILDILRSKHIVQNVLLSKIDSGKGPEAETLADVFLTASAWKEKWRSKGNLGSISFRNYKPGATLTLLQDSVLNLVHETLLKKSLEAERLNKKGSIIKVAIRAPDQHFAKLFSDRVVEESKAFYIKIKTNTTQQNVNRLERKADSLLALLNSKSYQAATAVVLDANPALRSLNVPAELKQRDKTILGTLYAEVVKNLELSRLSLSEQTPVIQILDRASYPLEDKKFKAVLLIALFSLGSVLLTAMAVGVRFTLFPPQNTAVATR